MANRLHAREVIGIQREAFMTRLVRIVITAALAFGLAGTASTGAAAKAQAKAQKKTVSQGVTGCLQKGDEPNTFKLSNVTGKRSKTVEIAEIASGVNLTPHIGHKVTVTGPAVSARAAAKAEGAKGTKEERGERHIRADAVTMISATCP